MKNDSLGNWIVTDRGLEKGYLRIQNDEVVEVCWGDAPADTTRSLILPALVNAHTHIGDSIAYPAPRGTVAEIVGPPDGFKHRMLRSKSDNEKIDGMRRAIQVMRSSGTALFGDFREEGIEGLRSFRSALGEGWPRAVVLSRPAGRDPSDGEIASLLKQADGLGISAVRDWPLDLLQKMSRDARSVGKLFAIHASEVVREDIDVLLDLKPDFLVHMCKATDHDIIACKEAGIPVVVCPSSNRFFNLGSALTRLLMADVTVGLGTDNGMIALPDMLSEMRVAYGLAGTERRISPLDIVRLATFGGRKVLNADAKITTEISEKTDLLVLRTSGDDPLLHLVTKAGPEDIIATVCGGKVGRTRACRT